MTSIRRLLFGLFLSFVLTVVPGACQSLICHARSRGNDFSDGSSWELAKADVMACYDALPPTGGTIYIMGSDRAAEGIPACKATDPRGCGIWIMGKNDPNYFEPPRGWRKAKAVRFIGVGVNGMSLQGVIPQVRISAGSSTTPGIWLSSATVSVSFENISMSYPNPSVRIGVDSNGDNTASSGWIGAYFKNMSTHDCNSCPPTNGPGWLIAGGNSFDIFIEHSVIQGNPNAPPGADNQAAILVKPPNTRGSADGLIDIRNSVVSGGGIKFYAGNNPGSLTVDNVYSENIEGGTITPGVGTVWIATRGVAATLKDVTTADSHGNVCDVRNDALNQDPAWITVLGGTGTSGTSVCGPAAIIAPMPTHAIESPLRQGQEGFDNGRIIGFSGNAQRQFGLYSPRFANLVSSNQSSWKVTGKGTLTTGVSAPDGTSNAVTATATGRGQGLRFIDSNKTFNLNDYFLAAVQTSAPNGFAGGGPNLLYFGGSGNTESCRWLFPPYTGDGEWEWYGEICKVTRATTSPGEVIMSVPVSSTNSISAYGPVLIRIPAGTVSDNEAYEIWNNLSSYPNACPVGAMCGLPGKPVVVSSYGTLSNCSSSASPAACGSAAAGSVMIAPGASSVVVNTSAVTANSQITLTFDSSLGAKLGATCNIRPQQPYVTARSTGRSFTISVPNNFTTNPGCISYSITN